MDIHNNYVGEPMGNLYIKYMDRWNGLYYLSENLEFIKDRSAACKFYILKTGNTTIINGDLITIHSGNKSLCIVDNTIRLINRNTIYNITYFTITDGSDHTNAITFDQPIYLISDKEKKMALRFESDLLNSPPVLSNASQLDANKKHTYSFFLERSDTPIIHSSRYKHVSRNNTIKSTDHRVTFIIVCLLLVILVLSVLLQSNHYSGSSDNSQSSTRLT